MDPVTRTYDGWIGRDAYDVDADRVGEITDIYYDDASGRPEWVTVRTGLFGMKRTFVPIHGSAPHGESDLRLAYDKGTIKDAPRVDPEEHLSSDEERQLWAHYGYDYADMSAGKKYGYGKAYGQARADQDYEWRRDDDDTQTVTRSEEELRVAEGRTERTETGKVRLRKYVVTENVKVDVPVTREEVRVTREPVSGTREHAVTARFAPTRPVTSVRSSRRSSRTRSDRSSPRRPSRRRRSASRRTPSPTPRRSRIRSARRRSTSRATSRIPRSGPDPRRLRIGTVTAAHGPQVHGRP